ncbi:unnamed protein product [Spirodela intermedia]|uniref:Uncharacterized protein n=1 Tax=Spirodela intermedia TaxID=51605 RepID=A0ABN7EAD6_SPIIN|nr:unnamed protein product [Spirodela intermedia]
MVPLIRQVMRATEIMRHVTQWLRSTHSLVPNKTKRSRSVCEAFGPGLLSDLLDGHHRGLDSGNSTSTEHLKATQDHLEEAAQEYLGRHHAMSRTHHNYYDMPWKPEVLIDLSDSAYPLYAYTALHYRPLHDSGVLLGGDQGWLLLAAEDHNGDTFIFGLIVMLQHSSILLTSISSIITSPLQKRSFILHVILAPLTSREVRPKTSYPKKKKKKKKKKP